MRILGLDVGDKRIGVAVSDELGWTSQGLSTINRSELKEDIVALVDVVKEWQVEKIVVGLPRNMNGTLGPQAEKVKDFIAYLQEALDIAVVYWDERLTTVAAQRVLLEGDVSRRKRKKAVDRIAAVLILQGYLDSIKR